MPSKGVAEKVTEQLLVEFRQAMSDQSVTQAELTRRVGCRPSSISEIFSGKRKQSPLVPRIQKALGLQATAKLSDDAVEMAKVYAGLDEEGKAFILNSAKREAALRAKK